MKKLVRSRRHRVLFGVCGGLAEYLGVSVALVRIVVLVLAFVGSGIVLYIAGMIIMPEESSQEIPVGQPGSAPPAAPTQNSANSITMGVGLLLVCIGTLVLVDRMDLFNLHAFWHILRNVLVPVLIILFGIAVLMRRGRNQAPPIAAAPPPLEQTPVAGGQWYRARYDRRLFGVCAGIAHAMNVDPTVIRLAWVLLSIHSFGFGMIVYLILALVLPEEPLRA